jgi:hypothetical protein
VSRRPVRAGIRRSNEVFDAPSANRAMAEKLARDALRRRARRQGLELRHTSYGYALINGARQRLSGRNNLTLDEVAKHLDVTPP